MPEASTPSRLWIAVSTTPGAGVVPAAVEIVEPVTALITGISEGSVPAARNGPGRNVSPPASVIELAYWS